MSILSVKRGNDLHYFHYDKDFVIEGAKYVLAFSINGGLGYHIPVEDVVSWNATIPRTIHKIIVGGEWSDARYNAYVYSNNLWNGWQQPMIERKELLEFIEENHTTGFHHFILTEDDVLKVQLESDDLIEIEPETITFNGEDIQVWNIGLGFCWIDFTYEIEEENNSHHRQQILPFMERTREEIEYLKKDWLNDPCWDLADTEGFEAHKEELEEFEKSQKALWEKKAYEKKMKRIQELKEKYNNDIWEYIYHLEQRLEETWGEDI